jgi:indole-3-glycerol phosphate synthase
LLEVHNAAEVDSHCSDDIDLIGVNNRDLATFSVSIETSFELAGKLPARCTKISESGISTPEAIRSLREAGYRGFLIGEAFMKTANPAAACRDLLEAI